MIKGRLLGNAGYACTPYFLDNTKLYIVAIHRQDFYEEVSDEEGDGNKEVPVRWVISISRTGMLPVQHLSMIFLKNVKVLRYFCR